MLKKINVVYVDSRTARQQGHILISVLIISDLYLTTVTDCVTLCVSANSFRNM